MSNDSVIQNKILLGVMNEFEEGHGLSTTKRSEAKSFERLVSYVVLSKVDPDAFSDPAVFDLIDVDKSGTFGIDTFALFVNDNLITSKEEIEHHRKVKRLEVRFVFIQTKRSTSVDTGDLLKFTTAVKNLLADKPSIPLSEDLAAARELIEEVFRPENARLFAHRRPKCELHFATSGQAMKDKAQLAVVRSEEAAIALTIPEVSSVSIKHVDAEYIIDSYSEIENRSTVSLTFEKSVPCDRIEAVEQAFVGFLPASEFLKLIVGADGNLRRNIFYENVRDFQGLDNVVNPGIADTLSDDSMLDKFVLLNNGVTIVAREFTNIRSTEYEISNYFVVNGCQTSHMIFRFREKIGTGSKLKVPVKIIHTGSNELIAEIVRSTNRQTAVPDEAFASLLRFHKRLQDYYRVVSAASTDPLYYERRSKEFSGSGSKIEKPRIVNLHAQIRSFTSVMVNEPQLVMSNHPSSILEQQRTRLFQEDHKQTPYYLSSRLLHTFHRFQAEGLIDGRYAISRYWVAWIARMVASGRVEMGPMSSARTEKDCELVLSRLDDPKRAREVFTEAMTRFDTARKRHDSKYGSTRNAELVRLRSFRDDIKSMWD